MKKVCSFFGPDIMTGKNKIKIKVFNQVSKLISEGYRFFYFTGFGDFDKICYDIVTEMRSIYKGVTRVLVCPNLMYYRYSRYCPYEQYLELKTKNVLNKMKILNHKFAIVENSNHVVFFSNKNIGGTYQTLKYAEKLNKNLTNITE